MKKILVVNDEQSIQTMLHEILMQHGFLTIAALTQEEGLELFMENPDVSAILLDGCVPGRVLNTLPLLKKFTNAFFPGPIVAMSSNPDFRKEMTAPGVGCANEWSMIDDDAIKKLVAILNRPHK